jgi:RNA polymerase primary sigma factor
MADDLYDDYVHEYVDAEDDDALTPDELVIDERRINRALGDLRDDFFRSGTALAREEVDRAAVRHDLSIADIAALMQRAEEEDLLESAQEAVARLDAPQELFKRSNETIDSLQTYINDVRRFPLLTAADEIALARTIETGVRAKDVVEGHGDGSIDRRALQLLIDRGNAARQRFVASNLRLAFAHAKVRRNQGLDFVDLLQEGTLGIIRAVDKFDYRLGYKFSTYATWWIRQGMDRALADKGRVIRLPVHIAERVRKIRRAEYKLSFELGREPTVGEVANATGFDPADVAFIRDVSRDVVPLDMPLTDEAGALKLLDLIPDPTADTEAAALDAIEAEELEELLGMLSYRERRVLELRYGLVAESPKTLDELGRMFNVTRERIRQIQDQALKKLQAAAQTSGSFSHRWAT